MVVSSPRDLAWCRAAFRDLDAPLPGRTGGPVAQAPSRRSWATGPIHAGPQAARLAPQPRTAALVARVVAESGYAHRRVDSIGATLLAWDEITRAGAEHLQHDPAAARALTTVRARWDLEEPMLWHVFGHHGDLGVAAQRAVVDELYVGGALHATLAAAVAAGDLLRF